jgi:hopanoid C-2 methylase
VPPTRRRVLIINTYFPEVREAIRVPQVPNALAPVLLAGMFSGETCDVRLYNEVSDGFLEIFAKDLLGWPDVVVFTGLTAAFDRMLQLTAYFRTLHPRVITVAGGMPIRALPTYSRRFFDYACTGDAEQLRDVIREALGQAYVAEVPTPRYDLAHWMGRRIGYAESSRNCNFRCTFCCLTATGLGYEAVSLDELRRQLLAMGPRDVICFQDNQFYGIDRGFFLERMALLAELRAAGHFRYWHAFVSDPFLWSDEILSAARDAGCFSVFVGVESFNEAWLRGVNKLQNVRYNRLALIQKCLDAGILFNYGLVFDPTERTLEEMHQELAFICDTPAIPAPNFIFGAVPFPGTPFFRDRYRRGLLLPNTRIRDLEGSTLTMKPLDSVDAVARFLGTAKYLHGYRARHLRRQLHFVWRHRRTLSAAQMLVSNVAFLSILTPGSVWQPMMLARRRSGRTHVSTTDRLDPVYVPRMRLASAFVDHFRPTLVTDAAGELNPALAGDLLATRYNGSDSAQ